MEKVGGTWTVGTPIVTYYAGPAMTEAVAQQMADAGFNLVWCAEKDLDLLEKHGLRGMLRDPLIASASVEYPAEQAKFDALIARVKNHPALYAYYITDEPPAPAFSPVGKLIAYIRERDPAHLAYVNLFPVNATPQLRGIEGDPVSTYTEYLNRFISEAKPALLSYDHYQFMVDQDLKQYFLNLSMMRRTAMEAKLPFINIVQASSWDPVVRVPNADETRYLVYTTLAYGAQGISYYVYNAPKHQGGIAADDGKPTPIYAALKTLNPEFVAIASELQKLRSLGVYHTALKEEACEPLPADAAFRPAVEATPADARGLLLGYFGANDESTHAVIVNLDYHKAVRVKLATPSMIDLFDATTRTWSSLPSAEFQLPAGGGVLVRKSPARRER